MDPMCDFQLQEGSLSFLDADASAGHHRREKSKRASGRPCMKVPPQFFVNCFDALVNSIDVEGCSV